MEPPSDLKFKIINENTVEMSWARPSSRIEGFRIQVVSDAGEYQSYSYTLYKILPPNSIYNYQDFLSSDEPARDFTLDASATLTSLTNLTPDLDYSVSINSYLGTDESIPIFGQLTSKYKGLVSMEHNVCKQ